MAYLQADAYERGQDLNINSEPTQGYAEYDRNGRLRDKDGTGGAAASGVVRSRFDEDVFHTNHTAVWG
ncbi:hypothetical protein T492DRAFT_863451 [Pavlovales sp. CCMP2436]|nr:hypothetical protein T492DRAFT_863451 [Pavlovales sp. CCMP2436]